MKNICLIASAFLAGALVSGVALAPAQAKTMKECAAEWDKMKAAKQTGGMKYRDFSKQCMAGTAAAPAAPTTAAPAPATTPAPAPATTAAKPAPTGPARSGRPDDKLRGSGGG